jgi:hypothetical protein
MSAAVPTKNIKLLENEQIRDTGNYHIILVQYDDTSVKNIKVDNNTPNSGNYKRIRIIAESGNEVSISVRKESVYEELSRGNFSNIVIESQNNISKTISVNRTKDSAQWEQKFNSTISHPLGTIL